MYTFVCVCVCVYVSIIYMQEAGSGHWSVCSAD